VYTVLGDLNRQTQAQNFENGPPADGTGGVLRVTQEGGTVGSGIIGSTDPLNKYFAYGIRNSFGIDFDPVTGRLWDTENGPAANDELNLVEPGFNSGWRDLMGMAPAGFNFNNLVSFGGRGVYSDPEFVWNQVVAPTAIEFLPSSVLGSQYQNDMFVADFNNGRIYNFDLNAQRSALVLTGALSDRIANTDSEAQQVVFGQGFQRITDLKVGTGDGYLYVLSIGDGTIRRILPENTAMSFSGGFELMEEEESNDRYFDLTSEESTFVGRSVDNAQHLCEKSEDRIDEIREQKNREKLTKLEAIEITKRLESLRDKFRCGGR